MAVLVVSFIFSMILYLALTAGSGTAFHYWSSSELVAGVLFSLIASALAKKLIGSAGIKPGWQFLNPIRWVKFLAFAFGPFLYSLTKANIDVAARVITGRINPGIVKVNTGLKNDFGLMLLANSVTLTPGTLSVDADSKRNLYVHCINLGNKDRKCDNVCGSFIKWARRITE